MGHESAKLPAGGFEGALLLLGVVVIEQWSAILDEIKDNAFDRDLSEGRRLVEVTDVLAGQLAFESDGEITAHNLVQAAKKLRQEGKHTNAHGQNGKVGFSIVEDEPAFA